MLRFQLTVGDGETRHHVSIDLWIFYLACHSIPFIWIMEHLNLWGLLKYCTCNAKWIVYSLKLWDMSSISHYCALPKKSPRNLIYHVEWYFLHYLSLASMNGLVLFWLHLFAQCDIDLTSGPWMLNQPFHHKNLCWDDCTFRRVQSKVFICVSVIKGQILVIALKWLVGF